MNTAPLIFCPDALDRPTAAELFRRIEVAATLRFVVDLSAVRAVDGAGLQGLFRCLRLARRRGGDLKLVIPDPRLLGTLVSSRLYGAFDVSISVADARQGFIPTAHRPLAYSA